MRLEKISETEQVTITRANGTPVGIFHKRVNGYWKEHFRRSLEDVSRPLQYMVYQSQLLENYH